MNKADLIKAVMENVHLEKREPSRQQFLFPELDYIPMRRSHATKIVTTLFEIIKNRLERGDHLLVSGFGKLHVKFKWARKGRNPKSGESIFINSSRVVVFKISPKLKERINKGQPEKTT